MPAIINVFLSAIAGVGLFHLLHLPMPWLLGPIFTVMLSQLTIKRTWSWPSAIRNGGLILLGAAVGEAFTAEAFAQIGHYLLYMIAVNIGLILFCVLLALATENITKVNFISALTASIPGGLSQSVVFAEEHRGIDIGMVTYFQVIRVLMIVSLVPFIVSGQLVPESSTVHEFSMIKLIVYIGLAWAAVPIGQKLKLPVPYFLAPVVVGILFNALGGHPPHLPEMLLHIAQLAIGAYIGLLLKPDMVKLPLNIIIAGIVSSLLLLLFSFGGSIVLAKLLSIDYISSFLSTAPGGMDQMSLIAAAMKADAALVTLFQLFRLLFIYFIVYPLLKWYVNKNKRDENSKIA